MARWLDAVTREKTVYDQRRQIAELRAELDKVRQQNERLRAAMRRCLTCEYRVRFLESGGPPSETGTESSV